MTAAPQDHPGLDRAQQPRPWRTQTAAAGLLAVAVLCLILAIFVL